MLCMRNAMYRVVPIDGLIVSIKGDRRGYTASVHHSGSLTRVPLLLLLLPTQPLLLPQER